MYHSLHMYLRRIRFEQRILLKDMADKLGIGSAELSQIEHGKKPMPEGFMKKVNSLFLK